MLLIGFNFVQNKSAPLLLNAALTVHFLSAFSIYDLRTLAINKLYAHLISLINVLLSANLL